MITPDLVTFRFVLSCLDAADVTEGYRSWMVDSQLTKYLETRHHEHTLESLRSYVSEMRSSSHSISGIVPRRSCISNEVSFSALQGCGYAIEGVQRSQVRLDDGQRDDVVLLGRTRQDAGAPTS